MTSDLRPADSTIGPPGLRLHYRTWGSLEIPPFVLLHGPTSHARSWEQSAPEFCDNHYLVALDQRDRSDSEHTSPPAYRTNE